jgi:Endosomal/lysosomal potassium channel TMEM175
VDFVVAGPGYADLMADADEAAGPQPAANDPPSSELVNQHDMADAEDQVALIQHEMEFASAERLAFFSDAVVAIALTLLALGLPVPGGIESPDSASVSDMIRDAARHVDDYLAFLISFLVIGAHWRLHHRVFRYVRHATRAIIRAESLLAAAHRDHAVYDQDTQHRSTEPAALWPLRRNSDAAIRHLRGHRCADHPYPTPPSSC